MEIDEKVEKVEEEEKEEKGYISFLLEGRIADVLQPLHDHRKESIVEDGRHSKDDIGDDK